METGRGEIRNYAAYLHSKVLDHSDWQRGGMRLPRNITPSDNDTLFDSSGGMLQSTVLDANGAIIFAEWSRSASDWRQVSFGQRIAYANCIRDRTMPACAVLGGHDVSLDRPINTRADISRFQVMIWDSGPLYSEVIVSNRKWQSFIFNWMGGVGVGGKNMPSIAQTLRRRIIGFNAGMTAAVIFE